MKRVFHGHIRRLPGVNESGLLIPMRSVALQEIVRYCDRVLRTREVGDYSGAVNGLQVENRGKVTRIAAAVDASLVTARMAVEAKADLLLVHHGFFWGPSHPWTGARYQLLRTLVENDLAVYSSHLPLDAHPQLGNNIQLIKALGLKPARSFFESHGQPIGRLSNQRIARSELASRLAKVLGAPPLQIPAGPEVCRRIGVVTGGAGTELRQAAEAGIDTFITGEGPHWTFALAEELGVNVFYGGHYATETFGVKAMAANLSSRFKLPWIFLDHPTGL